MPHRSRDDSGGLAVFRGLPDGVHMPGLYVLYLFGGSKI